MAQDRKIQFATQVITKKERPQSAVGGSLEEYDLSVASYQRDVTHTTVNKSLGGNGYIDINSTQWGDAWTSMSVLTRTAWEDIDEKWEVGFTDWEGISGDVPISSVAVQLTTDTSALAFCYIKNTGSNIVKITLNYADLFGRYYPLKLLSGGSVVFCGYPLPTAPTLNDIGVVRDTADSTIEYVLAKA